MALAMVCKQWNKVLQEPKCWPTVSICRRVAAICWLQKLTVSPKHLHTLQFSTCLKNVVLSDSEDSEYYGEPVYYEADFFKLVSRSLTKLRLDKLVCSAKVQLGCGPDWDDKLRWASTFNWTPLVMLQPGLKSLVVDCGQIDCIYLPGLQNLTSLEVGWDATLRQPEALGQLTTLVELSIKCPRLYSSESVHGMGSEYGTEEGSEAAVSFVERLVPRHVSGLVNLRQVRLKKLLLGKFSTEAGKQEAANAIELALPPGCQLTWLQIYD